MNKDFLVKPNQGVLLNYFSLYLNYMNTIRPLWQDINKLCKKDNGAFGIFYLFGASDVLLIGISNTNKILSEMQKINSYQKIEGVMDYFTYYGMIISVYPKPFNFNKAIKENRIVGIINLKIRHEAWVELFKKIKNVEQVKHIVDVLLKKMIKNACKETGLNTTNYKAITLLSYGCEDIIIILLADSFQFIKLLSTNLRSLELKNFISDLSNIKLNMKHIAVSTYTIFGVSINKNNFIYKCPKQNIGGKIYDQLMWHSYFEIRAGHLQNAIDTISNLQNKKVENDLSLDLEVCPIAGRHDLVIFPKQIQPYTLNSFLKLHHYLVSKLRNNSSFLSSETYISFPKLKNIESKDKPKKYPPTLSIKKDIKQLIKNIGETPNLHILEKESFTQLVRKLGYLLEDRYLQDSFLTLTPIIFAGVKNYIKLKGQKKPSESPLSDLWTPLVELSYATRYQGSPSIGETAVCPTLGYYSLGEKSLTLLDFLSNKILRNIIKNYKKLNLPPLYIVNININSFIAATIPIIPIPTVFILLPPRPLFNPEILMLTFLHELGHVVFHSFAISLSKNKRTITVDNIKVLEEPFAELFAAKILANLKFTQHKRNTKKILGLLQFRGQLKRDVYKRKLEHIELAKNLYEITQDRNGENIIKDFLKIKDGAKEVVEFLNFIVKWNDDVVRKTRLFFESKNKAKEFWNLWVYFYNLGEKCYFEK